MHRSPLIRRKTIKSVHEEGHGLLALAHIDWPKKYKNMRVAQRCWTKRRGLWKKEGSSINTSASSVHPGKEKKRKPLLSFLGISRSLHCLHDSSIRWRAIPSFEVHFRSGTFVYWYFTVRAKHRHGCTSTVAKEKWRHLTSVKCLLCSKTTNTAEWSVFFVGGGKQVGTIIPRRSIRHTSQLLEEGKNNTKEYF